MRLTWIAAVALLGCGGRVTGGTASTGMVCTWVDGGTEQETCSAGLCSVTIICGGGLVCRSPSGNFTKLSQVDYCPGQGYIAAFDECGCPQ